MRFSSRPNAKGRQISNEAAKPLYLDVLRAALLGLFVNLMLGVVKLWAGIVTNSFALISDAVNSLGDVLTTLAVLFSLRYAQLPPDEKHPYGHTRAEAIAGINVALVVALSAVWVGFEAVYRFSLQHEIPATWTLWIALGNVVLKEGLYHYKIRVARRTGSSAIMAHAWDHRSDAFCALAVLIGLAAIRFGGAQYIWADEAVALIVVAVIFNSAFQLFRKSASELMDAQADSSFLDAVRSSALEVEGVLGIETLWIRKSGLEYLVDLHLEVDPDISVREGHSISHALRDHLLAKFDCLRDVLVHLEPFEGVHSRETGSKEDYLH